MAELGWVCFAFLPFVFLMTGRWNQRKARDDEIVYARLVKRELAGLNPSRAQ